MLIYNQARSVRTLGLIAVVAGLSACEEEPAPPSDVGLCKDLLVCMEKAELPGLTTYRSTFATDGSCWRDHSHEDCRYECRVAIDALRPQNRHVAACQRCKEDDDCSDSVCDDGYCVDPYPYGNPDSRCNEEFNELRVQFNGYDGEFCSPRCMGTDRNCPDPPPDAGLSEAVCAVLPNGSSTPTGCALRCDPDDGDLACALRGTCEEDSSGDYGFCTW